MSSEVTPLLGTPENIRRPNKHHDGVDADPVNSGHDIIDRLNINPTHSGDGEIIEPINRHDRSSSRGYVGSILLAISMIAVSAGQEIAVYVSNHQRYWVQIVNSSYIIAAFCILGACWRKRIRQMAKGNRENEIAVAISIFWIFGAYYDIKTICVESRCFREWLLTGHEGLAEIVLDMFYHSIRPIYKFSLVIVYWTCRNWVFPDYRIVRYGLMVILATNLSIWVELLFDEAAHVHKDTHKIHDSSDNNHSGNHTEYCSGNNSGFEEEMDTSTRVCLPSMVEFTLLIVECVVHWFVHCGRATQENKECKPNNENNCISMKCIRHAMRHVKHVLCNLEFWLKGADLFSISIFGLLFLCSVALNVCFGKFAYDASMEDSYTSDFSNLYIFYSITFWTLNIFVTISTYVVSRRYVTKNLSFNELNGIERLLLLSVFGPMLMAVFSLISIIHEWYSPDFPDVTTPWKFLFQEGTNTVQIFIQVPLIFYLRKISTANFNTSIHQVRRPSITLTAESDFPGSVYDGVEDINESLRPQPPLEDHGACNYQISDDNVVRGREIEVPVEVHAQVTTIILTPDSHQVFPTCTSNDSGFTGTASNMAVQSLRPSRPLNSTNSSTLGIEGIIEENKPNVNKQNVGQAEYDPARENGSENYEAPESDLRNRLHIITNWPKYVLLAAIFQLLMSNATHWAIDNFVDPNEKLTLVKAYFSTTYWPIVASVLAPLGIFFRFHSAMLFSRAWRLLSFKRAQHKQIGGDVH